MLRGLVTITSDYESPGKWIASVVHLTDMHLYLALDGTDHRPVEHEGHIKWLEKQAYRFDSPRWRERFAGLSEHNQRALRRLKTRLPEVIRAERADAIGVHGKRDGPKLPIIVAQTGDIETFGGREIGGGRYAFPGWAHLRTAIAPLLDDADAGNEHVWIDIFGNHDIWAGAFPATKPRGHRAVMAQIGDVDGLEGPMPARYDRVLSLLDGRRLELYRASTVPPGSLAAVFARGGLTGHPFGRRLPLTNSTDALRELVAVAEADHDDLAIRLLLFHNPVHAFDTKWSDRAQTAGFANRKEVARTIGRVPFHLVLAGHRHAMDPAEGRFYDAEDQAQKPLPPGRGQLVAESPTFEVIAFEDITPPRSTPRSFAVYRLHSDEDGGCLNVVRTVFRYSRTTRQIFSPSEPEPVISNLRLE